MQKLKDKVKVILERRKAVAKTLASIFWKLNSIIIGWINYYKIGDMKIFLDKFGEWLRHKVRVIILKQWKNGKTIHRNLTKLNKFVGANFTDEDIRKVSGSRLGWYRRSSYHVVNFLINPKVLKIKKKDRPGLVNPLEYYISKRSI